MDSHFRSLIFLRPPWPHFHTRSRCEGSPQHGGAAFGGEEIRPQDLELRGPIYSLIAYPDLQHLNQGHKRPRLPGRLLAASDCI